MVIYPNSHSGKTYTFHVIIKAVKGLKTINNNANPPLFPKDERMAEAKAEATNNTLKSITALYNFLKNKNRVTRS